MVIFDESKQEERLRTLRNREEEELAETLAAHHGIPYLDLSSHPINIDALRILKEADAREAAAAVFNVTDKKIDVAVLSPQSDKARALLESLKQKGYEPTLYMVSHQSLNKALERDKDLSYSLE